MSNQNLPIKQNEILNKPKVNFAVMRTSSAGYEVSTKDVENFINEKENSDLLKEKEKEKENTKEVDQSGDTIKKMKLSVTSGSYIPKNRQQPNTTSTTDNTAPITEQPKQIQGPNLKITNPTNMNPNYNMIMNNSQQMMMMNNPAFYRKIIFNYRTYA